MEEVIVTEETAKAVAESIQANEQGRIPQEELDKNWRNFLRRAAGLTVLAMADADMDFATIGARLGKSEDEIRQYVLGLIECTLKDEGRGMCDLAYAMGCRIRLEFHQLHSYPKAQVDQIDNRTDDSQATDA
jgi:hypothetical protein